MADNTGLKSTHGRLENINSTLSSKMDIIQTSMSEKLDQLMDMVVALKQKFDEVFGESSNGSRNDLCCAEFQSTPGLTPSSPLQPICPVESIFVSENISRMDEHKVFDEIPNSDIKVHCEGEITETGVDIGVGIFNEDDGVFINSCSIQALRKHFAVTSLSKVKVAIIDEWKVFDKTSLTEMEYTLKQGQNRMEYTLKQGQNNYSDGEDSIRIEMDPMARPGPEPPPRQVLCKGTPQADCVVLIADLIGTKWEAIVDENENDYVLINCWGEQLLGISVSETSFSRGKVTIFDECNMFDKMPQPKLPLFYRKIACVVASRPSPKPPPQRYHLNEAIERVGLGNDAKKCEKGFIQFVQPYMSLYDAANDAKESGKVGQSTILRLPGLGSKRVGLIGIVSSGSSTTIYHNLGEVVAAAAKSAHASNVAITFALPEGIPVELKLATGSTIATGAVFGTFDDTRFKSESKQPPLKLVDAIGLGTGPKIEKKLKYAGDVCSGVIWNQLVNASANVLSPGLLAFEAQKITSNYSDVLSAKILDVEQCT